MEPRTSTSQMIGTVLSGRYRLEAKLGSGGMSTVYLARDETLDRPVAVKVMHREMSEQPDQLQRFRQEARAVAQLSHPNVVAVIDAGEDGGHPYIVFEYVEGETLKQRIARTGALEVQDAVAYAIEVAHGISVAHSRNMVHRDIKPQNVLIDVEGRAKVTDFGIARQLEQDGVTATGRVLGTTDYVAPEQAMGQTADPRSDLYSLGVVLYEMLAGDVPFHADSQVGVAMKHVNEDLPDVQYRRPEISAAVAMVVERATAKDPAERYQSAEAMIDDLETALEVEASRAGHTTGEATTVLEAVPPPKRKLAGRARPTLTALFVTLLLAAAVLTLVYGISSGWFDADSGTDGEGAGSLSGEAVALASAGILDPEPGDGEENDELLPLAIDGDPETTWTTDHYDSPDLGGIKDGVGMYATAERPVEATEIGISSPTPGWDAEIYAVDGAPPEDLEDWGEPVAKISGADERELVPLELQGPAENFMLWFTELSPGRDERYQVEIAEVSLAG
jgi:eukaryotic-like serine/threonine-protein kinase